MTPTQKGVQPDSLFKILNSMINKGFLSANFFNTLKEWGEVFAQNQWWEARTKEAGEQRAYLIIKDLLHAKEIAHKWVYDEHHPTDTEAGHRIRLAVTLAAGIRMGGFLFNNEPINDIMDLIEIIETRFGENATKEGAQTDLERKTEGNPPKEVIEGSYRIIS